MATSAGTARAEITQNEPRELWKVEVVPAESVHLKRN
ncbi:hypothetical protein SAMN05216362_1245 [Piscibacillus halophilus]|uniref:Uncharacterized protein n=1 Tax=Piscibacillus halophilus TaxID=571933 RepID=A0A1H9IBN2_9BACI|nr:hypothetical protein SAMN05216362_1245 [Piscibacillus halophilus]